MHRLLIFSLLLIAPVSAAAQTLTIRDVVELSKTGVGEEVLIALVEVHRSVFPIDRDTLKMLKESGVSDNVVVAMIRSGRDVPAVAEPPPLPTAAVVVDRGDGTPPLIVSDRPPVETRVVVVEREAPREEPARVVERVRDVPVAVPVYVPVPVRRHDREPKDPPKAAPVYWGFDGKLRPDAWQPAGTPGSGPDKDKK